MSVAVAPALTVAVAGRGVVGGRVTAPGVGLGEGTDVGAVITAVVRTGGGVLVETGGEAGVDATDAIGRGVAGRVPVAMGVPVAGCGVTVVTTVGTGAGVAVAFTVTVGMGGAGVALAIRVGAGVAVGSGMGVAVLLGSGGPGMTAKDVAVRLSATVVPARKIPVSRARTPLIVKDTMSPSRAQSVRVAADSTSRIKFPPFTAVVPQTVDATSACTMVPEGAGWRFNVTVPKKRTGCAV